jgi:hypothetical protein
MVYAQKCQQDLKYIPWKRILSQSSKALPSEIVPFLDLLAGAAGHADPPEQAPSPSPFGDLRLLMMRAVAWALVAQGLHAVGLRGPSLDGEICRQLNALLGAGFSQDQALHELVTSCRAKLPSHLGSLLPQSDLYNKKGKRPLPQPAG